MWHIDEVSVPPESPADVERWFRQRLAGLWPVALGSLSLRRSRCVRRTCHACETGEQHPSYVLYGRRDGRRASVYIPDDLAAEVRRALRNGQTLQGLLYEVGQRYARALKRERARRR
jgi:hypothetical protein